MGTIFTKMSLLQIFLVDTAWLVQKPRSKQSKLKSTTRWYQGSLKSFAFVYSEPFTLILWNTIVMDWIVVSQKICHVLSPKKSKNVTFEEKGLCRCKSLRILRYNHPGLDSSPMTSVLIRERQREIWKTDTLRRTCREIIERQVEIGPRLPNPWTTWSSKKHLPRFVGDSVTPLTPWFLNFCPPHCKRKKSILSHPVCGHLYGSPRKL
jgi:hypothetical protein